jgi:hypothetical protein
MYKMYLYPFNVVYSYQLNQPLGLNLSEHNHSGLYCKGITIVNDDNQM